MNTALNPDDSNERWYWTCQIGGWGFILVAQVVIARAADWPWSRALPELFLATVALLFATHRVRHIAHRQDWFGMGFTALIRRSLISSAVIAIAMLAIIVIAENALYDDRRLMSHWSAPVIAVNLFVTLILWHTLYFGAVLLHQRQYAATEAARLRASLRTAELSLLKSQLNPHFLFNALNTVRALISESPERAQLAVTQLARTLRYTLNSSRDELVALEIELGIVDDYLGIEKLRLAERLSVVKSVSPETLTQSIPIMLMQTLVENAVKHGVSQLPQGGTLSITTRLDPGTFVIEVANDRPLIKSGSVPSDRVGLANAQERLRLMIGAAATLKLDLSDPRRAIATVRIPSSPAATPASQPTSSAN